MSYWGDFPLEETLNFLFTTRSFTTGVPTVLAGTPVLSVYEDTNLTQITSGVTVTVDHDSVVGLNRANVVATAANGYETGKSYNVVITTGTVGGVSVVGEVVGIFTINRSAALRPTTAGRTLDVTATGAAGIDWANVENPTTTLDLSGTDIQLADTVTTNSDMRGTDSAATAANLATVDTNVDAILVDTAEIGTAGAGLTALSTAAALATVDGIVDAILLDTAEIGAAGAGLTVLSTAAALATVDGNVDTILVDTADMQPKLGTPAADLSADIAAVKVDTAAVLVDTSTTLDTKINDIQGATFSSATDSLEAIRNRGDAAWTTGAGGSPPHLMQSTTIATLASQTSFTLTAGSSDDDAYNGAIAVITDSATAEQKAYATISDYTGSTKTVTLSADPAIFTMATTDTIDIMSPLGAAGSAPTVAQIADGVWDEAQSGHTGAGTFGEIATEMAAILVDTADMQPKLGTPAADVSADIAAVKVDTAATLVDTAEIGAAGAGLTDLGGMSTAMKAEVNAEADTAITDAALATAANLATVDTNVDAVLVDTATTIPAQITALNDVSVADILTTQMTEAYAADGVAPTLAQAIFAIQQQAGDFSITGTTITVKKLDGSTTAMTFTLDDGTDPTSRTRAT